MFKIGTPALINLEPYFENDLPIMQYEIKNSNDTFVYNFPSDKDPEGTDVTFSIVAGLESFMKFDKQ